MNQSQGRRLATLIVIVGVALTLFIYWTWPSDEKAVRRVLTRAEKAVENEDFDGLSALFSQDFTDDTGIPRTNWEAIVRTGLKVYADIKVDVSAVRVTVSGDRATINFNARAEATYVPSMMAGGMPQVDAGSAQDIALLLEKRDGEWIVVRAERLPLDFIPQEAMEFLK